MVGVQIYFYYDYMAKWLVCDSDRSQNLNEQLVLL